MEDGIEKLDQANDAFTHVDAKLHNRHQVSAYDKLQTWFTGRRIFGYSICKIKHYRLIKQISTYKRDKRNP
jgi:hypothetical protein